MGKNTSLEAFVTHKAEEGGVRKCASWKHVLCLLKQSTVQQIMFRQAICSFLAWCISCAYSMHTFIAFYFYILNLLSNVNLNFL